MSDPYQNHESPADDDTPDLAQSRDRKAKRALIYAGVGGALGAMAIVWLQVLAPETDYQHAFFGCVAVGVLTLVWVFVQLLRHGVMTGHPWRVPIAAVLIGIMMVSLVRIRTLSGEMVPQFAWRFSSEEVPELQQTPILHTAENESGDVIVSRVPSEAIELETETAIAGEARDLTSFEKPSLAIQPVLWSQFLGNNRDGVVPERTFAIPTSPQQVKTIWNIGIGGGWASFAVAGDIAVTLEQRDDRECVTAYRMSDGQLIWLVDHEASHFHPLGGGGPRTTPAIVGDRVFAQGSTGTVWCLDLLTGNEVWKVDLLKLAGWTKEESEVPIPWGRSGSPLIVDGLCVVPYGGPDGNKVKSLIALDADSGEKRWIAGRPQLSYASPQLMTLAGKRQIVSVNEHRIIGHDIETGGFLWGYPWYGQTSTGANCAAVIPAGPNRFLIGKGYGGGSALIEISERDGSERKNVERADATTTENAGQAEAAIAQFVAIDVWTSKRFLKTKFNHVVVRDGVAYGLSNGALQAVEIESGKRLWEQSRRGRFGQGQVILAGDTLVVQAEEGEVALVAADPDKYDELIRIPALQHKTWNVPSLAGNILLVRNGHEAMALQLPPLDSSPVSQSESVTQP